jgi:hypothetical protein
MELLAASALALAVPVALAQAAPSGAKPDAHRPEIDHRSHRETWVQPKSPEAGRYDKAKEHPLPPPCNYQQSLTQ